MIIEPKSNFDFFNKFELIGMSNKVERKNFGLQFPSSYVLYLKIKAYINLEFEFGGNWFELVLKITLLYISG